VVAEGGEDAEGCLQPREYTGNVFRCYRLATEDALNDEVAGKQNEVGGRQVPPNNELGVVTRADLEDISASGGMFQIMGFNWQLCQQASLNDFRTKMEECEAAQLALFFKFIIGKNGALDALAKRDWAEFAKRYSGPSFRKKRYDTKLAQYYYEAKMRATP
jgi:hypothetical protein